MVPTNVQASLGFLLSMFWCICALFLPPDIFFACASRHPSPPPQIIVFNRVRRMTSDPSLLIAAMRRSNELEIMEQVLHNLFCGCSLCSLWHFSFDPIWKLTLCYRCGVPVPPNASLRIFLPLVERRTDGAAMRNRTHSSGNSRG